VSNDVYEAARTKATVVVLMGIHKLAEITEIFKKEGKNKLPVAIIQSGSTKNEKVAIGIVDTIVEVVEEKKITSPALIVFGEVVSLHPKYQPIKEFYDIIAQE
jgi:uroporphyrin-III C-methyltransferase